MIFRSPLFFPPPQAPSNIDLLVFITSSRPGAQRRKEIGKNRKMFYFET
jgi:hypothetical protein